MSISVIACGVFKTDLETILKNSPALKVTYLKGGLHSEPNRLRTTLQETIDKETEAARIVLLYGLCGSGLAGLRAGKIPLIIPRVHDCISLFLGSDAAYSQEFRSTPGTYYISAGWYEEQVQPRGKNNKETPEKHESISLNISETPREELAARYGTENADAIMEVTRSWEKNYKRAVFIDTGAGDKKKYSSYVDAMGSEFGWRTETLKGSVRLIQKALETKSTDGEMLFVTPGQVTYYNLADKKLCAAFPEESDPGYADKPRRRVFEGSGGQNHSRRRFGLGIDAGGTYTDAVLFDFKEHRVIAKAKALTTPWNYTEGIAEALEKLKPEDLRRTELVSVSTTLATNAIVENNRQSVGLLLMPLEGTVPGGLVHRPLKVIKGRMNITGEITGELDEEEIRTAAREMVKNQGVQAFAVSGYGGTVNPAHEKQAAAILRDETGLMVCAGHELSGQLDFTVRAATAVLNAGIIPHLETFFHAAEECLVSRGITAPVLFVRGDGFLMNAAYAMEHPIETALSGPAASVAGAGYLTGMKEATVIDIGGTTSDIGCISGGRVEPDPDGAMIGNHRTHVRAVDMVTLGIGGDSEIRFHRGAVSVGPGRITPLCRLKESESAILENLEQRLDDFAGDTAAGLIIRSTGKEPPFLPDRVEAKVLEVLKQGPLPVLDLAAAAELGHWRFLKLHRLFSVRCLEPVGLTPTDLLHVNGRLKLGNPGISAVGLRIHAALAGISEQEYSAQVWKQAEEKIAAGVVAKLLDIPLNNPAVALLVSGGSAKARLHVTPAAPVVGLGAAAPYLLGGIKRCFGVDTVLPEHGDVANALGAVTSSVHAIVKASIIPAEEGFRITGEPEILYTSLADAELTLEQTLLSRVRDKAAAAGTSETRVNLTIKDRTARSALGEIILLERCMEAEVRGLPDLF